MKLRSDTNTDLAPDIFQYNYILSSKLQTVTCKMGILIITTFTVIGVTVGEEAVQKLNRAQHAEIIAILIF